MQIHPRWTIIEATSWTRKRRTKTWRSSGWRHTARPSSISYSNWRHRSSLLDQEREDQNLEVPWLEAYCQAVLHILLQLEAQKVVFCEASSRLFPDQQSS